MPSNHSKLPKKSVKLNIKMLIVKPLRMNHSLRLLFLKLFLNMPFLFNHLKFLTQSVRKSKHILNHLNDNVILTVWPSVASLFVQSRSLQVEDPAARRSYSRDLANARENCRRRRRIDEDRGRRSEEERWKAEVSQINEAEELGFGHSSFYLISKKIKNKIKSHPNFGLLSHYTPVDNYLI